MASNLTKVKARINSVKGAYKVTSAMKLVSSVKLNRWKTSMLANREYANAIDDICREVFTYVKKVKSPFSQINDKATKNLYIVLSSTLGLCGAYNNNIFKLADAKIQKEDDAIILGGKGISHFQNGTFHTLSGFEEANNLQDSSLINTITNLITNEYLKGTYREIHLIYSYYRNSLVFIPTDLMILPLKQEQNNDVGFGPILEPNEQKLMDQLVPIYLKTIIQSKFLESEVCEQAARSNAMDNATNNAKELLDNLQIEFNKARQAAITQEITEIVSAANAL
ncbi:MAG: ATP synthase F1 subunit gamma [Bacilli bacterium]|nr:ATP synthase F1 subunit gamma [Bacilli bacterium]